MPRLKAPLKKHALGCIPSLRSINDIQYKVAAPLVFPSKLDLMPDMPKILNQGSLGACTGHGTARAFKRRLIKEGLELFDPSRLMIYYNARALEGTIMSDSGATIRSAVKAAVEGVCDETVWPYDISKFTTKPSTSCYNQGLTVNHRALAYKRLNNSLIQVKTALLMGNAVIIGFAVYESFYRTGKDGRMSFPVPGEGLEGGHCVTIEGYDDSKQRVICGNSWGPDWGDKGRFTMPYNFLTNPEFVFELWVIEDV